MTDEELRTLVASLATSTANNERESRVNAEAIRELRVTVETQGRVMTDGFATLRDSAETQARSIEALREGMTYNTETMASALELAALSQRSAAEAQRSAAAAQETAAAALETAAAAMELSANTSRNLDRLENDIADLKQIVGIVIRDNQADRGRITRLEDQE
jgi:methyl-accepting chemotaxis protein